MNRTTNHIMKLDQAMTYDDAEKMQKFTEGLKGNERLKIEIGTTTFKLDNGTFETNITAIFTKTNKTNLEKIINTFEKMKNNIKNNKSLFHKPELMENILNYSSISVKKLNLIAKENKKRASDEDLKKGLAEFENENITITSQNKLPQETINKGIEDYKKYTEENNKNQTEQNNPNENKKTTEADKMWKIINDDIGL